MTNLQKIRKAAGLSQAQLAAASGVSIKTIQSYEHSERKIEKAAVETALRLAEALKCSTLQHI